MVRRATPEGSCCQKPSADRVSGTRMKRLAWTRCKTKLLLAGNIQLTNHELPKLPKRNGRFWSQHLKLNDQLIDLQSPTWLNLRGRRTVYFGAEGVVPGKLTLTARLFHSVSHVDSGLDERGFSNDFFRNWTSCDVCCLCMSWYSTQNREILSGCNKSKHVP